MKRIVFVIGNYKNGGMAMHATHLSNAFAEHGYLVDILVTGERGDNKFIELHPKVRIISLSEYNSSVPDDQKDIKKRKSHIKNLKRIRYITRLLPNLNINKQIINRIRLLNSGERLRKYFLYNNVYAAIAFGAPYISGVLSAKEGMKCKVIFAEKTAPEQEIPKESKDFDYFIYLLKKTNVVIVQTQYAKEYYAGYIENICVINNPLNPGLPMRFIGQRDNRIVNYCRLSKEKNIELLFEAFRKIHSEYCEFRVEIYGNKVDNSEIEYEKELIMRIKNMGLDGSVKICPPVADVHNKVMNAAMFVSTSNYEGLSNSMLESMAIGLPCICTDCSGGGTREVMIDHENGLVVPVNDPYSLYLAMKEYICDPELSQKCSINATKIRDRLNIDTIAKKWIDIIESV